VELHCQGPVHGSEVERLDVLERRGGRACPGGACGMRHQQQRPDLCKGTDMTTASCYVIRVSCC
jgi:hypothetical protein